MEVTDKKIVLENKLVEKLDLMLKRLKGDDDCDLVIDGDEGMGKSNLASGLCYYVAYNMKREYSPKNIFFNLDNLITFASKNEKQVIHWDEAALGGLSVHWWTKNQTKFMQLMMIARKKKHFMVMCIPKFNYLREYFFLERSIALLSVYARKNVHKGRFFYFTKRKKEALYDHWKRRRYRAYGKFKSFGGTFRKYMEQVFTLEQLQEYEKKKDNAIANLNNKDEKESAAEKRLKQLQHKIINAKGITRTKLAEVLGMERKTFHNWEKKLQEEAPLSA